MGKHTRSILSPKKEGLTGKDKPRALIVHSPFDESGGSVDYDSAVASVRDIGYGMVGKGKLEFNQMETSDFDRAIKAVKIDDKPLTIWLESHGAPGWLFGGTRDARDEFRWTVNFAKFIQAVEAYTGSTVDNIVLSGCFTANEILNPEEMTYMNSPARVLSILLPGKNIIGFVGQNASAKVTNVFHRAKDDTFTPVIVNPEDAAILFRAGSVVESYHDTADEPLYCTHKYTPMFISEHCKLGLEPETKASLFYQPCLAQETVAADRSLYVETTCYGAKQLEAAGRAAAMFEAKKTEAEADAAAASALRGGR